MQKKKGKMKLCPTCGEYAVGEDGICTNCGWEEDAGGGEAVEDDEWGEDEEEELSEEEEE